MPPKKTIIVNPDDILLAIHRIVEANKAWIDSELVEMGEPYSGDPRWNRPDWHQRRRWLQDAREDVDWLRYDLAAFSGRNDLTESEKQIWRRTIRNDLGRQGLVQIYGIKAREIRLTEKGRLRVDELLVAGTKP